MLVEEARLISFIIKIKIIIIVRVYRTCWNIGLVSDTMQGQMTAFMFARCGI